MSLLITVDEVLAQLENPRPPVIIDCRPEEEYLAGHLPGAKNVDSWDLTPEDTSMMGMVEFNHELDKKFSELSNQEKAKVGDGGVAIEPFDEIEFTIRSGQRKASVFYLAPTSSDLRRFTVTDESGDKELGSTRFLVGIEGLVPLRESLAQAGVSFVEDDPSMSIDELLPNGGILMTGQTSNHSDNLNGTPEFNRRLVRLAKLWILNTDLDMLFNDQSLPLGGKFSIPGEYERRDMHFEHRTGENIDINTALIRQQKRDPELERLAKISGLQVFLELEDRHYHLRLGVGQ